MGIPVLHIHYERTDNDRKILKDAFQNLQELMSAAGAEVLYSDESISTPGAISHEMGTTRMGNIRKPAFLNGFCQAHDLEEPFRRRRRVLAQFHLPESDRNSACGLLESE